MASLSLLSNFLQLHTHYLFCLLTCCDNSNSLHPAHVAHTQILHQMCVWGYECLSWYILCECGSQMHSISQQIGCVRVNECMFARAINGRHNALTHTRTHTLLSLSQTRCTKGGTIGGLEFWTFCGLVHKTKISSSCSHSLPFVPSEPNRDIDTPSLHKAFLVLLSQLWDFVRGSVLGGDARWAWMCEYEENGVPVFNFEKVLPVSWNVWMRKCWFATVFTR